jgi:hypothetical protein
MLHRVVRLSALALLSFTTGPTSHAEPAADDARAYVKFVEDISGNCTARNAKEVQVKNTHPSRRVKVWLDRYQMGVGTGDRSHSELTPNAPPEPLGCSRTLEGGTQEWRVARAVFVDQ